MNLKYTFQNGRSSFEFSHTHKLGAKIQIEVAHLNFHTHKFDKKFKSTFIFEHNFHLKLCTFYWEIRVKRVELWAIYA